MDNIITLNLDGNVLKSKEELHCEGSEAQQWILKNKNPQKQTKKMPLFSYLNLALVGLVALFYQSFSLLLFLRHIFIRLVHYS